MQFIVLDWHFCCNYNLIFAFVGNRNNFLNIVNFVYIDTILIVDMRDGSLKAKFFIKYRLLSQINSILLSFCR